jgi:hypothetical protein
MVIVEIQGYLVQGKLESALMAIVGTSWIGREQRLAGSRRRWDMCFTVNGAIVAAEFDGDEHYCNSLKIKADREKDELAKAASIRVVRVPYWIQLTDETLRHYFGLEAKIVQNFPHGFITTKIFPASFCELGIERFRRELNELPSSVRDAVLLSLRERVAEHGIEYVLPTELRGLVL